MIVAKADLEAGRYPLLQTDAVSLQRASARRRLEFAAGRACARAICSVLGRYDADLGISASGAPVWPRGLVGTITHSRKMALAAGASARDYENIGIDTEIVGHIEDGILDLLFSRREIEFLESLRSPQREMVKTALFCSKEAFFKAKTAMQKLFNSPIEIEIEIDVDISNGTFCSRVGDCTNDIGLYYFYGRHCVAFYLCKTQIHI